MRKKSSLKKKAILSVSAAFGVIALGATYLGATSKTINDFEIREHVLDSNVWDDNLGGLRAAFLTDMHIGSGFTRVEDLNKIVDQVNATNPDIALIGGDLVVGALYLKEVEGYDVNAIAQSLGRLRAPYGTYLTLGNHDWIIPKIGELQTALQDEGIILLENDAREITLRNGRKFAVTGLGDFSNSPHGSNVSQAFQNVSENTPKIVMAHDPRSFLQMSEEFTREQNVALMIAGHTHCGQIRGIGNLRSSLGHKVPLKMQEDFYRHNGTDGFTGCGIGNSSLEIRNVAPRVDIITIK